MRGHRATTLCPLTNQLLKVIDMAAKHFTESKPKCAVYGCTGKHRAKGYCGKHYVRIQRTGSLAKITESHGKSKSPEYKTWVSIKSRCYAKSHQDYIRYGARGIVVCDKWRSSFLAFYSDMGHRPSAKHSIDRIDNSGNYCPENCRWASILEQARNRRDNRLLTVRGKTKTLVEWSEMTGANQGAICSRLRRGWSEEDAVFTPVRAKLKNGERRR